MDSAWLEQLLRDVAASEWKSDAATASSSTLQAPASGESLSESHVSVCVLEHMRLVVERALASSTLNKPVQAAFAAWRFLTNVYARAEQLSSDAGGIDATSQEQRVRMVQAGAVSGAVLLLSDPALVVEESVAGPQSLLSQLLRAIAEWLGDQEDAASSVSQRFFAAVMTGVLEDECDTSTPGMLLPEDPSGPRFRPCPVTSTTAQLLRTPASIIRSMTLLEPRLLVPLRALRAMVSIPALARQFVCLDEFLHPWSNGQLIETSNVLGIMFKATCLPDDPAVGDHYFRHCYSNGQLMPDVERQFVNSVLHKKLDGMHASITDVLDAMVGNKADSITRFGIVSWLALFMLSNFSRTRMLAARRAASTDGVLLNVAATLLRVWERRQWGNTGGLSRVDPLYVLAGRRLELQDETRLAASAIDIQAWIGGTYDENKFQARRDSSVVRPAEAASASATSASSASASSTSSSSSFPPTAVASAFTACSLQPRHVDIVCDKCRVKNPKGARYKCSQCNDYDLCEACATLEPAECHQLAPKSGVLFRCPYPNCAQVQMDQNDLRSHVQLAHTQDPSIVACPVCAVNAGPSVAPAAYSFINPNFELHLQREHGDAHNPTTHVLLKCPRMLLFVFHRRMFSPLPAFPLEPLATPAEGVRGVAMAPASDDESDMPQRLALAGLFVPPPPQVPPAFLSDLERIQREVVHRGVSCSRCHEKDIRGVAYRCAQCAAYTLCAACEAKPVDAANPHPSWHVFLQFRRPLLQDASASAAASSSPCPPLPQLPMPSLYPSALTGEPTTALLNPPPSPSIESEWFFLTAHSLHLGFSKTCARYTSLVQNLDAEQSASKIETLLKVKLCVDAQLLHPTFLLSTLRFYCSACQWMRNLIDPQHVGLPLAPGVPMEFAALPEYLIDDSADTLLFLTRFGIDLLAHGSIDVKPVIHLFIMLLASPSYAPNPYLRAKLVESLCSLADNADNVQATLGKSSPPPAAVVSLLSEDAFAHEHLVASLIRLFVDVGTPSAAGGGGASFFEKYNVRHSIGVLLKHLVRFGPYREALAAETQGPGPKEDRFIRFENALINDLVYLVDESTMKAAQFHTLQTARPPSSVSARRDFMEAQASVVRSLRTASTLAGHNIALLALLVDSPPARQVLLRPELLSRVLQFANQFVSKVCSPSRRNTLPLSAESANIFPADEWIHHFLSIFLRLKEEPLFTSLMGKDESGFVAADFRAALERMRAQGPTTSTPAWIAEVESLLSDLEAAHAQAAASSHSSSSLSSDLPEDEVPEDFLDPLMSCLMEDPVLLPSGVSVDRHVILRHLLNDSTDPFNRQQLTKEQLVPNVELKNRIEEWQGQQRAKAMQQRQQQQQQQQTAELQQQEPSSSSQLQPPQL